MDSKAPEPLLAELTLGEDRLRVYFNTYMDGTPAIVVRSLQSGAEFPYATLSTNLSSYGGGRLDRWEIWIKAHDENAPLAQAVLASGVFMDTGATVRNGFADFAVWRIADDQLTEDVCDAILAMMRVRDSEAWRPSRRPSGPRDCD